jgi:SAM-dependent MidA family methyltransferase
MTGNAALIDVIQTAIDRAGGRITFAQFMELALYHPVYGYYTAGRPRVGKDGDFFTSVSVGPLFGRILATQIRQFRAELGEPSNFTVIECGGQHGQLRADILAVAPELNYEIIEWGDVLPDKIVGCVLSNELLDAFPVHRVIVQRGQWRELYVTRELTEVVGPLSTARLSELLRDLPVRHMEGYQTEINLCALDWLDIIAPRLQRGYLLTIDYGFERPDYFAPHRHTGHLQCYHQHHRNTNPFEDVGEQDITAHVEFSSFIEHGEKLGLESVLFTDQGRYLIQTGASDIADIVTRTAGTFSKERAAIHQLTHPAFMGRAFKVLIQCRQ